MSRQSTDPLVQARIDAEDAIDGYPLHHEETRAVLAAKSMTPLSLLLVVSHIKASARADGVRHVAAKIYNGAGDPEQEFYDRGFRPWLEQQAAEMDPRGHR